MITHHLAGSAIRHLAQLEGKRWECIGTPNKLIAGLEVGDLITCPAILSTEDMAFAFSIQDNEDLAGGDYRTLTIIQEEGVGDSLEKARKQGTVFFHGKGERISSVALIRESLVQSADGEERFRISSDSGVVISLESTFIVLQRRGFGGFDFIVSRAQSREGLRCYPTEDAWPMSLRVRNEYERAIIPVNLGATPAG